MSRPRWSRLAPAVAGIALAILIIWLGAPLVLQRVVLDGDWQLTAGTLDGSPIPIVSDHPTTLTIAGGRLSGRGPCNEYGGYLDVSGSALRPHDIFHTLAACIDVRGTAAESAYFAALDRVSRFQRDGPRLILSGSGVELKFEPARKP